MNCPRCNFRFGVLAIAGGTEVPELAPMICEGCTGLLLLVNGVPRIPTPEEQAAIERSPAFLEIIRPLRARLLDTAPPAVDRSKTMLTDGSPVPVDHSHVTDRGDGQQRGYVVLSDEERLRGFVRPYRESYVHKPYGAETKMGRKIAETYARNPGFYGATFCARCGSHFPLDQFIWSGTDERVGS